MNKASKKFENLVDDKAAVDLDTVADSTIPWKQRIVEWMTKQEEPIHTAREILEATDQSFNPKASDKGHYIGRKHCLDSQLTYIRQDYGIRTRSFGDQGVALLGIENRETKKLIPFKNAVSLLTK